MQIAIASQNRKIIGEHAGRHRKFWIYEVTQGEVSGKTRLELPPEQGFHQSSAVGAHPLYHINILIASGIGPVLHHRLQQKGIQTVVTRERDPDRAVAALLAGRLEQRPSVGGDDVARHEH